MNNTLKIVVAVAAGAAAGAALGILFAPDKGSEIRRKIAEQGKKIADNVKDRFETKKNEWRKKAEMLA
jgi:gas vesicle protein